MSRSAAAPTANGITELYARPQTRRTWLLTLSVAACSLLGCMRHSFVPDAVHGFVARQTVSRRGTHKYWVYRPTHHMPAPAQKWPVILYLHGGGERGQDGLLPTQVGLGPAVQATLGYFPFIVVFPQCDAGAFWAQPQMAQRAMEALQTTIRDFNGDPERVYLTGNSLGGSGTWFLPLRYPGRFAALAPICGGVRPPPWIRIPKGERLIDLDGDPYASLAQKLGRTPVWIFHGADDFLVPVSESRRMAAALRQQGGIVRYTEWPGVGHAAEEPTYADPAFFEWLLKQRLGQPSPDADGASTAPAAPLLTSRPVGLHPVF